ncbi:hypothetical protein FIBSPDRAFT_900027 [Athelia psychrophila]|uniref:Uncharacterized protein n=1 Tax=Athelia psychrophila TaxID=1759441 RepID=A0A165YYP4_9AGAM|nr:hypothetical protein FIBSPDRAFT_900027 [Fibularhizoctonia sp. CBS 109695]
MRATDDGGHYTSVTLAEARAPRRPGIATVVREGGGPCGMVCGVDQGGPLAIAAARAPLRTVTVTLGGDDGRRYARVMRQELFREVVYSVWFFASYLVSTAEKKEAGPELRQTLVYEDNFSSNIQPISLLQIRLTGDASLSTVTNKTIPNIHPM